MSVKLVRWIALITLFATACTGSPTPPKPTGPSQGPTTPAVRATARPGAPNIVFILTDDQRTDQLSAMPTLQTQLVAKGMSFDHFYVVDPLCCPSRAATLTGSWPHTN